jgi:hypothetical protein
MPGISKALKNLLKNMQSSGSPLRGLCAEKGKDPVFIQIDINEYRARFVLIFNRHFPYFTQSALQCRDT